MTFRHRLKTHVKIGIFFSVCITILLSAQQGKFSLEDAGLLFGLAVTLSVGFTVGAFLTPRKTTNE